MRAIACLVTCLLSLCFSACNNEKQEIVVTVIQINDVYEIAPVNRGKEGGYARLKYLVDSLKRENPNTILLHAGDFLSPSLIGNLKNEMGKKVEGEHMIEVMNAAGIDYVTFGNHEFDIKAEALLSRIDESQFNWLSANVIYAPTGRPFQHHGEEIPEMARLQFVQDGDTFSLGLSSVTLPFNQKGHVKYLDGQKVLREVLDAADVDEMILLTHQNREDDHLLAEAFPEIKLIMGGHEHFNFADTIGKTVITKADANLRTAWRHVITFNTSNRTAEIQSDLIPINSSIPEDPAIANLVKEWTLWAAEQSKESGFDLEDVVWEGDEVWECRETIIRSHQTNFGELIGRAVLDISGADVALINSGSLRYDDEIREVLTQGDLLKAMPFGGGIQMAEISGGELQQLLNVGLNVNRGSGGYLQMTLSDSLTEAIQAGEKYKVATSDFVAAGREKGLGAMAEYSWEVPPSLKPAENDIRKISIQYLKTVFR